MPSPKSKPTPQPVRLDRWDFAWVFAIALLALALISIGEGLALDDISHLTARIAR